jgi:hypothetical protein
MCVCRLIFRIKSCEILQLRTVSQARNSSQILRADECHCFCEDGVGFGGHPPLPPEQDEGYSVSVERRRGGQERGEECSDQYALWE